MTQIALDTRHPPRLGWHRERGRRRAARDRCRRDRSPSSGSMRGVAEDYLVMPSGGELAAQMKFITADPMLGGTTLKFTDLALFGLSGRWSLFSKLELGGVGRSAAEAALVHRREAVAERGRRRSAAHSGGTRADALGRRRSPDGSRRHVDARGARDRVEEADRQGLPLVRRRRGVSTVSASPRRTRRARPRFSPRSSAARPRCSASRAATGARGSGSRTRCRCRRAARSDDRTHDRSAAAPRLSCRHGTVDRHGVGPVRGLRGDRSR